MQTEKRNVLIVVIASLLLVGILICVGYFVMGCVNHNIDKKKKLENWTDMQNYNTTVIVSVEGSNENTIEIPLKELIGDKRKVIDFHGDARLLGSPQVGIVNDDVTIVEVSYPAKPYEKKIVRMEEGARAWIENGEWHYYDYLIYICKIYKSAEDDSLLDFITFEVHIYSDK